MNDDEIKGLTPETGDTANEEVTGQDLMRDDGTTETKTSETTEERGGEEDEEIDEEELETDEHSDYKPVNRFDASAVHHLSGMYQNWFLDYASYVILERAVPMMPLSATHWYSWGRKTC